MGATGWHFARPELAQAYLRYFELGLSSARALFARRRMGKTEFLSQDLVPAARQAGYATAYVNLWDNRSEPEQALIAALHEAVATRGLGKLLEAARRPVKKVRASGKLAGVGEGAVEAELTDVRQARAASELTSALRAVDKRSKRLLLVIDEAQVLATAAHADFTHALRAALDIRKDSVKVIFAGSSESTLRRMFAQSSEPFYNWAPLEPFELLDRQFVEFVVERANERTRHPLSLDDALVAFDALHRTPEFFRRFVERYLIEPLDGAHAALEYTREHVFSEGQFQQHWASLMPADRQVLLAIAEGAADLHGKAVREQIGEALGLGQAASMAAVQNALRRLQTANIVSRVERGQYQFEDEGFAQWVRAAGGPQA